MHNSRLPAAHAEGAPGLGPAGLCCVLLSLSDCYLQTWTPRTRPSAWSSSKSQWIDKSSTATAQAGHRPALPGYGGRDGRGPTAMQPPAATSTTSHHPPRCREAACWDSGACGHRSGRGKPATHHWPAVPGSVLGAEAQRCRGGASELRLCQVTFPEKQEQEVPTRGTCGWGSGQLVTPSLRPRWWSGQWLLGSCTPRPGHTAWRWHPHSLHFLPQPCSFYFQPPFKAHLSPLPLPGLPSDL